MKPAARVLLVEDDTSLQRFVELALEELSIELEIASRVDTALESLRARPAELVITDLMLPDQSGMDLLAALDREPALRASAKVVVFSAGLTPEIRQQLTAHRVWRMLSKPCSVTMLEDCVREGLAQPSAALSKEPAAEQDPIALHFAGNAELYQAFRASCLAQFKLDMQSGDQACTKLDAASLQRLAHSLKSVLLTLGATQASAQARALEDSSARAEWSDALPQWQRLRAAIENLR